MEEITPMKPHMEAQLDEFQGRFGVWVECGKCRALMYDSFEDCWSCGAHMTDRNKVPVRL